MGDAFASNFIMLVLILWNELVGYGLPFYCDPYGDQLLNPLILLYMIYVLLRHQIM